MPVSEAGEIQARVATLLDANTCTTSPMRIVPQRSALAVIPPWPRTG
jgi:hypothetical protein